MDLLGAIVRESARFGQALAGASPDARVPSCPEWDAADLLWHLTEVQLFWGAIVARRLAEPDAAEVPESARPATYAQQLDAFRQATDALVATLADTPAETPCWTWADDRTVGFVLRRQAHEALVHRLDAELVAGIDTPVDVALACDGVDELLRVMFTPPGWAELCWDEPIGRLAATDAAAEWFVRTGRWGGTSPNTGRTYEARPTFAVIDADAGEPAFTVGAASRDLDAWLWRRPTLTRVEIHGDASRLVAALDEGVQ